MSVNQKKTTSAITMDARKFLHGINESAQAKIVFFERLIKKLGDAQQKNWKLVALHPNELMFEDVDTHVYCQATIKRDKGGKLSIEDIKKINVVEEKKEQLFNQFCTELVEAISEDNQHKAEVAFNKIESCRFRPNVIPHNGHVRTRDGRTHYVPVIESVVAEDKKSIIVAAAVKALKSDVKMSEGRLVSATIVEANDKKTITLPIDELVRRRVVARNMRAVAENAWKQQEFQEHVQTIAGLISESKITESVEYAAKFLNEYQEFSLLDKAETKKLIENALISTGCFNSALIEDCSVLFYKTNMKINRNDIIESWQKTAAKTEFAPLISEVNKLAESKSFDEDYGAFLKNVFMEAADVKEVRRLAYLNSMKLIRNVIDVEDDIVADQLQDLIDRLETPEVDDATLREAEDLLASISEELMQAVSTLDDFDKMPGEDEELPEIEPEPEVEPGAELEAPEGEPSGTIETPPEAPAAAPELEVPESVDASKIIPISEMNEDKLVEELACWEKNHELYVTEDGIKDCMKQLNEYIDRAETINCQSLAEKFRSMRDQHSVISEKQYFGMPSLKKPATKIKSDYKKVNGVSQMTGSNQKGEGHKMDAEGTAIGSGKLKDAGHEMDRVDGSVGDQHPATKAKAAGEAVVTHKNDHPANKKGKGPAVKGIAEAIEGKACECGAPIGEDELLCPKCKGAGKAPDVKSAGTSNKSDIKSECTCECGAMMECDTQVCPKCGAQRMSEDQIKDPKIPGIGLKRSAIAKESVDDDIDQALAEVLKNCSEEDKKVNKEGNKE